MNLSVCEIKALLVEKMNLNIDDISKVTVQYSLEVKDTIKKNPNRYNVQGSCFVNAAQLTMDSLLEESDITFALAYGVRLNSESTIKAFPNHPEMANKMIPLSVDAYAFGHAITYDHTLGEYNDPTLQDSQKGLADFYFVVKEFDFDDLSLHFEENDNYPPFLDCLKQK